MDSAKYRIRFGKGGDLRFLSHHDLMRAFERMLRRSGLPFRSTEGFHPHPRIVFALSLPLGVVGRQEVVELQLTETVPPGEVLERLRAEAPPGIELMSIRQVPVHGSALPCRAVYALPVSHEQHGAIGERCTALLARGECWVERSHPRPRRVDIRPYVNDLRLHADTLEIDLKVTATGSARADEVLALLGLAHVLNDGAVLERAVLELTDETSPALPHSAVASCGEPQLLAALTDDGPGALNQ